jgi:hypothetical protein
MIAKRIDMRVASKSRATRLAEYVMNELGKAGRVGDVFTVNCLSDDPLIAAKEMEVCQAKNTRAKDDKTYHLLLSFPDGERPDRDRLRKIAATAAKSLGHENHQRIAVVHDDTDNLHMHVIINKIHPERHTIHTPRYDYKILGELCANLEKTLSLRPTNHEPSKTHTESKAQDMEKHSGLESFIQYAREKATPALAEARTWAEVHTTLAGVGIALHARGNGLVLVEANGGTAVKASSVGREFSKAKLEKRLGMFVTAEVVGTTPEKSQVATSARESYLPRPLTGTSNLYQQYLESKRATTQTRKVELAALWEKQKHTIQAVMDASKLNLPTAAGTSVKRALRKRVREAVKVRIARIRHDMAKTRAEIKAKYKTRGFVEWLKLEAERGNVPAIYALRKRGAVAPALVNITARDLRDANLIAGKIAHVTGRGTLFYKAGDDVFRDNGSHLFLQKDISDQGVKAALMIAMTKFDGHSLVVNGSAELKAKCIEIAVREGLAITFSDTEMEQRRNLLARRRHPQLHDEMDIKPDKAMENSNSHTVPSNVVKTKQQGVTR